MFNTFDPYDDEPVFVDDPLTDDERIVGMAYARLAPLLRGLQRDPFARHLYERLRDYLDDQAWQAADAYERLCQMGPDYLRERLDALCPSGAEDEDERE